MTLPDRLPPPRRDTAGTRLLRVDSSIRTDDSVSRALADTAEQTWRATAPDAEVTRRDLGTDPLAPVWPTAAHASMLPPEARRPEHLAALALAAEVVDELLAADALLVAAPLYNFGTPQQIKHWIDLAICDPRANDVSIPLLPGRPAILVVARGGGYAPGTPRAGWDHATAYLERILGDVWGLEVSTVAAELTAATFDPAMAHLVDQAAAQLTAAHEAVTTLVRTAAARARGAAHAGTST